MLMKISRNNLQSETFYDYFTMIIKSASNEKLDKWI